MNNLSHHRLRDHKLTTRTKSSLILKQQSVREILLQSLEDQKKQASFHSTAFFLNMIKYGTKLQRNSLREEFKHRQRLLLSPLI